MFQREPHIERGLLDFSKLRFLQNLTRRLNAKTPDIPPLQVQIWNQLGKF